MRPPIFWAYGLLRKEIKKSGIYLSICESYRDDAGRVQRRILRQLDNANDYTEESLAHRASQLIGIAKGPAHEQENIQELSRHNYGFPLVLRQSLRLFDP